MNVPYMGRAAGVFVFSAATLVSSVALAIRVGDVVAAVEVRDANDNPATIPELGAKVITLFYTDPDVKDQNEPFRDLLKAQNLDPAKVRGVGVVNMKDTWKPNFAIRGAVRDKLKKFPLAVILTDPDHVLKNSWNLGDCDEKDVVVIIGKDRRVAFFKAGKLDSAEMEQALRIVRDLMTK
jgi:predicted transcriptional regulator